MILVFGEAKYILMRVHFFTLMDNDINGNISFKEDLHLVVNDFFNQKGVVFDNNHKYQNKEFLYTSGVLKSTSNGETIDIENKYVLFSLYRRCKEMFSSNNDNQIEFSQFISLTDSLFLSKPNYYRLRIGLTGMFIIDLLQKDSSYFVKYLSNKMKAEDRPIEDRVNLFCEGYIHVLIFINIDLNALHRDLLLLIEFIKSNSNITYLMNQLYHSIRAKSYLEYQFGVSFFQYLVKQRPINKEILIPIIAGLYNRIGTLFFKENLMPLIDNKDFEDSIISGITDVKNLNKEDVEYFIGIYDKKNKANESLALILAKMLFSILLSKIAVENHHISKQCFRRVEELLNSTESDKMIDVIMMELEFTPSDYTYKIIILKKCIAHPKFNFERHLKIADRIIWRINDVKLFFESLDILALKFSYTSLNQSLEISINQFSKENQKAFDETLISFLIDNDSKKRYIGLDVFNSLSNRFTPYSFSFNILSLKPIEQYKIWVSLLQKHVEPKYVIPPLIPLLQSNSETIRESFVCKLEEYSESYGGILIEVLKENMDMNSSLHKIAFERISTYSNDFFKKNILVKNGVKELNPLYTQHKIYMDYNKNHNRKLNRQINMGAQDSMIFNFAKKIVLAKGGGWKHENNSHISELGNFSTSFSLPRVYFIAPEIFDYTFAQEISEDWNDRTFDIIEKLLENE